MKIEIKELSRFEIAFNCDGFFERDSRYSGVALCLLRIFIKAMQNEGYGATAIARVIKMSRRMVYVHGNKATPLECAFAEEFVANDDFKYNGCLGDYNV